MPDTPFFSPRLLLQLEGLVVLVLSVIAYSYLQGNWWLFALLFLAPDLFALGYIAGVKIGSYTYNLVHNYVIVALLLLIGFFTGNHFIMSLALIWSSHIGFDRLLGFGLKYPTEFKDTHIQHV